MIKNLLNPKGHQNRISGSKVTAILLKGWILPIGGVALGRVCACSLCNRLVYLLTSLLLKNFCKKKKCIVVNFQNLCKDFNLLEFKLSKKCIFLIIIPAFFSLLCNNHIGSGGKWLTTAVYNPYLLI